MLTILIDIFIIFRIRKQAVIRPLQFVRDDKNIKRQKSFQKQMFILMLASVCIFLITSLPLAIYKITSPRETNLSLAIFIIITIWASLEWFQSLFCAINFYIHCLSSTLFRKEFEDIIKRIWNRHQSRVTAVEFTTINQRTQTHKVPLKY
ncbi:unnamed protein product [Rotaria sp. Silwood2]|nr:unnamed protein product [Rotaria sp. Silwood2]